MGFSEIFGMVASYEFAYFAAPRSAQSLYMSLRFCSIGVSSFIGAVYIAFFPRPSFKLDFSVSIAIEQFYFSSCFFSVPKRFNVGMEFLYLFLHSRSSSVDFHYHLHFMSEKISNH